MDDLGGRCGRCGYTTHPYRLCACDDFKPNEEPASPKVSSSFGGPGSGGHIYTKHEWDLEIKCEKLEKENAELRRWKKEASETMRPILDFKHADMILGDSKVQTLLRFANERDKLKAELDQCREMSKKLLAEAAAGVVMAVSNDVADYFKFERPFVKPTEEKKSPDLNNCAECELLKHELLLTQIQNRDTRADHEKLIIFIFILLVVLGGSMFWQWLEAKP